MSNNVWQICLIFLVFMFLKLGFVIYGYVATEEGILLNNARLAYSGLLPFVNYNAWNSLLNDYFNGWWYAFLDPTLFNQRLYGLLISATVFFLTLTIAFQLTQKFSVSSLSALFMTFGSYTYLYLSTIPYSEQTMTLFFLAALLLLSIQLKRPTTPPFALFLIFSLSALATLVRIQGLPATILIWLYLTFMNRKRLASCLLPALGALAITTFLLFPFLKHPDYLLYSITWPLRAQEILIYQQGASISLTNSFVYFQELFRDYGVLVIMIISGLTASFFSKKRFDRQHWFVFLLIGICGVFALTGFLHKPPYASYLYQSVPLLGVSAAYLIDRLLLQASRLIKTFTYFILLMLFVNNFLQYPHYKLVRTSLSTLTQTPLQKLAESAEIVKKYTQSENEVLSFYTPLTVAAARRVPLNLNEDRFSLTLLPTPDAAKYHLTNSQMLKNYIAAKRAKILAFSDSHAQLFGQTENERQDILTAVTQNYELLSLVQLNEIEYPMAAPLKIYLAKP